MKAPRTLLFGLLTIIFVGAGCASATPATERPADAPPHYFSLEDYDGNTVTLSDFNGKHVIVNSWATWCAFCKKELPDLAILQEEFADDVVVIAIDRVESLEKAKQYSDDLGVTGRMVLLLDPSDSFYKSIGGFSMPETVFLEPDGSIQFHKRGVMDLGELRTRTQALLAD